MQLNIKYFGLIAEVTQCNEETLEFSNTTMVDLKRVLFDKYPELKTKDFKIAHKNELVEGNIKITSNEIALLPPFSGG